MIPDVSVERWASDEPVMSRRSFFFFVRTSLTFPLVCPSCCWHQKEDEMAESERASEGTDCSKIAEMAAGVRNMTEVHVGMW